MFSFPDDIITVILTKLPVKSLFRFRCVCKSWCNLFTNPNFVKLQLNNSLVYGDYGILHNYAEQIFCVDYDSSSSTLSKTVARIDYPSGHMIEGILGSCNGLLLCNSTSYRKDIIIWNPYTKDYKKIPTPPETIDTKSRVYIRYYMHGFGYDVKTDDYMFARLANIWGMYSEIVVYSLKLNLWKTYRDIPALFPSRDLVFVQGIFYWVETPRCDLRKICSFDIGSETFKEIPPPQHFSSKYDAIGVCLLGGCLYLIGSVYMSLCDVWMMRDYGRHESWTKMFTIVENGDRLGYLDLKQSFKNCMILVHSVGNNFYYLYDLEQKRLKKIENRRFPREVKAWAIVGSLVSPNLGTCQGMQ